MIAFHLDLSLPESPERWLATPLLSADAVLRALEGHAILEPGEDLLGSTVAVRGHTELEGALAALGPLVERSRVASWTHTREDGEDWVRIEESGALQRDATASDLFAHLAAAAEEGNPFFLLRQQKGRIRAWGVFPEDGEWSGCLRPLALAAATALPLGGRGALAFLGADDEDDVAIRLAFGEGALRIEQPDPQDLDDKTRRAWLGRTATFERAYAAWCEEHG